MAPLGPFFEVAPGSLLFFAFVSLLTSGAFGARQYTLGLATRMNWRKPTLDEANQRRTMLFPECSVMKAFRSEKLLFLPGPPARPSPASLNPVRIRLEMRGALAGTPPTYSSTPGAWFAFEAQGQAYPVFPTGGWPHKDRYRRSPFRLQ